MELTATRRTALHRYSFPAGTQNPRILVDITNDGQKSSTSPEMTLDPITARVVGGASFSASFGPGRNWFQHPSRIGTLIYMFQGRYNAYTCVDFKAEGYTLEKPTEYGAWSANYPVRGTANINQLYYGGFWAHFASCLVY